MKFLGKIRASRETKNMEDKFLKTREDRIEILKRKTNQKFLKADYKN